MKNGIIVAVMAAVVGIGSYVMGTIQTETVIETQIVTEIETITEVETVTEIQEVEKIVEVIGDYFRSGQKDLKKVFYDIPYRIEA